MIHMGHIRTVLAYVALGCLGCSEGGISQTPTGPDGDQNQPGNCLDQDGDGLGPGCASGLDCDDGDPSLTSDCQIAQFGDPWEPGSADGLTIDDEGWLTLGANTDDDDSVWIANSTENTVTRLDARTGREVARYPSAIPGANHARPTAERCDMERTGNCPSRTSIDLRRDCWVANRAFGNQGTLTKIAANEDDCIDRNGNGVIDTSRDTNDNGKIDAGEMLGDSDECVLFTVDVGGVGGVPRALAIAPDARFQSPGGNAWVGTNQERKAYEIDGETGAILRTVDLPLNPYGALAGKLLGVVWFVNAGWQASANNPPAVVAVEFATGVVQPRRDVQSTIGCVGTYGITLDEQGRVWTGGFPCEATFRYDPSADSWLSVDIGGQGVTRGLVGAGDGSVWVAHSSLGDRAVGNLTKVDTNSGQILARYSLPTGLDSIGVDLDRAGNIWTINRQTNNAARLDPLSSAIEEFSVGEGPYTYSDFTGHSLRLQFPLGTYTGIAQACEEAGATWLGAQWEGEVPDGALIEVRVRTAATREALEAAQWFGPWGDQPIDLQGPPGPVPSGGYMEFQLTLRSVDGIAVPRLRSFALSYFCPIQ